MGAPILSTYGKTIMPNRFEPNKTLPRYSIVKELLPTPPSRRGRHIVCGNLTPQVNCSSSESSLADPRLRQDAALQKTKGLKGKIKKMIGERAFLPVLVYSAGQECPDPYLLGGNFKNKPITPWRDGPPKYKLLINIENYKDSPNKKGRKAPFR